jgi:hypothetical protein
VHVNNRPRGEPGTVGVSYRVVLSRVGCCEILASDSSWAGFGSLSNGSLAAGGLPAPITQLSPLNEPGNR